jgi:hypothetical protein
MGRKSRFKADFSVLAGHKKLLAGRHLLISDLGYYAAQLIESQLMFLRNMPPPSSGLKSRPREIPAQSKKMEVACSSKGSVDFQ